MRYILFSIVVIGLALVGGLTTSASELSCVLSTATSTGCAPLSANPFVAFAPSASPTAGNYSVAQEVTFSASESASIRYTRDGASPTCAVGTLYTIPLPIKKSQTLRAIACYPGGVSSAVSTHAYLLSVFDARTADAALVASGGGAASLPTNATSVTLSNTTKLDLSSAVATSSAGQITVGGTTQTLANFTRGNLSAVNLSTPVEIGGASVSVERAVALSSGVSGTPLLLTNGDFADARASIPDGAAVLAPAGWNGTIAPPKERAATGSVPGGFAFSSSVVEVGSEDAVLLFDTPVSVVLSGRAEMVAYLPSGSSTWVQIANTCGGSYDVPTAPVFPGECKITDDTTTKIYSYHLTSFALLEPKGTGSVVVSAGGNGPVGGGGTLPAADLNGDGRVDILDFNFLLAAWGAASSAPFGAGADLNRDGKIDIVDFTLLLARWN